MAARRLFTSEAVFPGHPDKVADQVSDAVLDTLLEQDPMSRVACETLVKNGLAIVAGEVTTRGYADIPKVVKQVVRDVGYTDPSTAFNCHSVGVLTCLEPQSPDIALGVDADAAKGKEIGAGDQGIMFGYACTDTPELMPAPIVLARALVARAVAARESGRLKWAKPDGKCQVTVEYEEGRPVFVDTVVLSMQHAADVSIEQVREEAILEVVAGAIPSELGSKARGTRILVNPTGRFVEGGPQADCGLTGRKIICDTYGGMGRHGGGAFSGKDPTKVDRSAAYAARHAAKNIVAAGLADRCEIQLGYAIGVAEPVSVLVETFGTHRAAPERIEAAVRERFRFSPSAIIERFGLRRPLYAKLARWGHVGGDEAGRPWEACDEAKALRDLVGV